MRRYIYILAVDSVALLLCLALQAGQVHSQPTPDGPQPGSDGAAFAPARILVKVKDGAPADAIVSINRRNDAHLEGKIPHSRVSVVDLPADLSVAEAVEVYEASPAVEYAEPDYAISPAVSAPTPNDPIFPKMYDLYNRGQYGGTFDADIDGREAWNATTGATDTVVAVLDTGMDINHRDLNDNVWTNPDEIADNGVDDDRNGYVDDVHGWDFFYDDASVFDGASQDTHGTHVAGTIAAEGDNGVGVTGVNWQAKVMPLKFIGPGNVGYVSGAVKALDYAVAEGVKISNNSYGFYDNCNGCYVRTLQDAISRAERADHLFVAAAMNGGADYVGDDNDDNAVWPASYGNANIISVAASNDEDELTSFSNYGATSVDLAAPGKSILSTLPGNAYGYGEGTSMATPHVAGAAALVKSQYLELSGVGIKARILESVDEITNLKGKLVTGGRLNVAKALGANTAPVIVGPGSGGKIRDRTPVISATVRDDETELTVAQIRLYLDGRPKQGFSYDQATDRCTYESGELASGRHRVQVVVEDGQGFEESYAWTFRVVSGR
jgi:thermitase